MEKFQVVACPSTELSYTNKAVINPADTFAQFGHILVNYPEKNETFVFSLTTDKAVEKGKIAFNLSGRKWASLMIQTTIEASPYKFELECQCLNSITFYTDFMSRQNAPTNMDFDTTEMSKQFSFKFNNQAFTVGQLFGFAFEVGNRKVVFELKVKEMDAMKINKSSDDVRSENIEIGLTTPNTVFMFERAEGSDLRLTGKMTAEVAAPRIFNQSWDFEAMGIGGLSEQFNKMFRRAFASRLLPPQFVQDIGEEHVKGMLLYGPPGTGKTLIARQIGKMLLAREPKIVNGPEILNKYVGESEANIRKLFAEAEEEQAKSGINSGLHMIIFDEIDALCKSRGTSAGSSGVGDNVVNQLLTKIDGVDALNNVLLIGMTNRRDLIDEALLRPGRLELQIEIGLPSQEGRLQIFKIHTSKMFKMNMMDPSVNLEELAEISRNYTGAEIAGLCRAARSLAYNRVVKPDANIELNRELLSTIKITREDFLVSMEQDVKPALGSADDKLKELACPMIEWDPEVATIQSNLRRIVNMFSKPEAEIDRAYYLLLLGEENSGTTTIAANLAAQTKFPFIRVYEAEATAGQSESAKISYMQKLFDDAGKSELSCIVIDDLEIIMDYHHIGPQFSRNSLAVFTTKRRRILRKGHRMLVICTCKSEQFLNNMKLDTLFNKIITVPKLTKPEQVRNVLTQFQEQGNCPFTPQQSQQLIERLAPISFKMGIKQLCESLLKNATGNEPDARVKTFMEEMHELKIVRQSKLDEFEMFNGR